MKKTPSVAIVGAGLAGSEVAWQLAERGYAVQLFEMRPVRMTAAHKTANALNWFAAIPLRAAQ